VFSGATQVGANRPLGNVTTTTVTALTNGTTYTFKVAATNAAGTSAFSANSAATTPVANTPAPAGISFVGRTQSSADNATTFTVAKPVGTATNDVLVAVVSSRGTPVVNTPAGWTKVRSELNGTQMTQYVFVKAVTATDPASYSFTLSKAGTGTVAAIGTYRGVSTTAPVVASAGLNSTTTGSVSAPGTTAVTGARVIGVWGIARVSTWTPPTGSTERVDVAAGTAASFKVSVDLADAGTTGTTTPAWSAVATGTASSAAIGQTLTLRPAG
jgi:titin